MVAGAVGAAGVIVLAPVMGTAVGAKQGGFVGGTVGLVGGAAVGVVGGVAVAMGGVVQGVTQIGKERERMRERERESLHFISYIHCIILCFGLPLPSSFFCLAQLHFVPNNLRALLSHNFWHSPWSCCYSQSYNRTFAWQVVE
mmetsp:Transcript_6610/g.14379  ORF Transcript_6610/g.14379 Transcript_6610/m.14379 type:complete len:143 (-) Transcript_6610:1403-1831(-)